MKDPDFPENLFSFLYKRATYIHHDSWRWVLGVLITADAGGVVGLAELYSRGRLTDL